MYDIKKGCVQVYIYNELNSIKMNTSCEKRKRETVESKEEATKITIESLDACDVMGPVNGALYYTLLREADVEMFAAIMEHCGIGALEDKDKIERHLKVNSENDGESRFDTVLDIHIAEFSDEINSDNAFNYTKAFVRERLTQTRTLAEVMITALNTANDKDAVLIDIITSIRDVCDAFHNYIIIGQDDANCVRAVDQLRTVVDRALKRNVDEYDTEVDHANMLCAISGIMHKVSRDFLAPPGEMW